jgi:hypothetical protein
MILTDRDIELIQRVHSLRLLGSRSHILPLYGSEHILRRCRALVEEGYLYALKRAPHEEQIYALGNKGADLVLGNRRPKVHFPQLNDKMTAAHIKHTLGIADVMIAIENWSQNTNTPFQDLGTTTWSTNIEYDNWYETLNIEPDRVFMVAGSYFFLEFDRGTMRVKGNMKQSSIFKKMLQYFVTWKEQLLLDRGLANVRTLFVLQGEGRIKTCIEANQHFDGGTGLFLFTTYDNLLSGDPLTAPLLNGRGQVRTLIPTEVTV